MTEEEKKKRIKEVVDLLQVGVLTNEKISEAYQKLFYFHCDWLRAFDIISKELH